MKLACALATLLAAAPAFADGDGYPTPPVTDPSSAPSQGTPPVETPTTATGEHTVDNPGFRPRPQRKDIVVTVVPDRDRNNLVLLAGITGAGLVLSAVGVYYNLDSKSAADEVTAKHPTSLPWTADDQAAYDRAHTSGIEAGVFYGLGGAVLVGAIVTYIVTQPKAETTVIHPHYAKAAPTVAPAQGGAVLGGAWRF
jgi:hypothetical protein